MNMKPLRHAAVLYVRHVLDALEISARELAKRANISSSTITRPLNDPDHKFTISTNTISKIYEATQISPAPFFEAASVVDLRLAPVSKEAQHPKEFSQILDRSIQIIGAVEPGAWRDHSKSGFWSLAPLVLSHAFYPPIDCFGVVVNGDSSDLVTRDGDVLLCLRSSAINLEFVDRNLYVVERVSADGSLTEWTVRAARPTSDGWELYYPSSNPAFNEILHARDDGLCEGFSIVGKVEFVVRYPYVRE